jgi:hypothetical protein
MDYQVYIYAEKVYHRDIRDYWMNKKRRESPLMAVHRSLRIFFQCLLWRKQTLRIHKSAAIYDPQQTAVRDKKAVWPKSFCSCPPIKMDHCNIAEQNMGFLPKARIFSETNKHVA